MGRLNQQKAGVLLSYLNMVLGSIIPLVYTPIMLRLLGQAEYGVYGLAHSVTAYLSLLNLGLGSAIVRYLAKYRVEGDTDGVRRVLGLFLMLYSCAAVLICVVGGGLAICTDRLFAQGLTESEIAKMRILVLIMTVSVAISLPISTFASLLTAYERFVFTKVVAIITTVAIPVFNLVVLYMGRGSVGMAVIGVSVQLLSGVMHVVYCGKTLKIMPTFRKMPMYLLKELAVFCLFMIIATIADLLYWSTDKVLIGATLGSVAVAIYNVGGVFTSIMQNLAQAISQVFTPKISMMATKKDQSMDEISDIMIRVGRLQFFIVSFILSGYAVFGQCFIRIWAGEEYAEAYYVALLTMIPLSVPLIQSIALATITAQNKHRFRAVVYVVIAVVNVISTWLVLPYWGIVGAAACTMMAFTVGSGIVMNIYYYRVVKLDIPRFWENIYKIAIVPLLLAVCGWFVVNPLLYLNSWLELFIGALLYSVVFWLLNWFVNMNRSEKQLLLGNVIKRG